MAKPGITNITTSQTFQNWFDKTNELVDIIKSDAITASGSGDTTVGDATLTGDMTATNLIATGSLLADTIENANTALEYVTFSDPIFLDSPSKIAATFSYAASGGQTRYTNGTLSWDVGLDNNTDRNFLINTGVGNEKFKLSPVGTLTVPNLNVIENTNVSKNVVVTENVTANNFFGTFIGSIDGQVSSISNFTTDDLSEGSTNLYFTTARARGAFSAGTGVAISSGSISIGQAVGTSNFVTFGGLTSTGNINTATLSVINNLTVSGTITAIGSITSQSDITAFVSSSDIKLKENINRIDNALDKISEIGGYTYNFIGQEEVLTGVIAQEVEKVIPGIVYDVGEDDKKHKAVRYGNLVGLLIEGIKELKTEIEEIKKKL